MPSNISFQGTPQELRFCSVPELARYASPNGYRKLT